jgi:glucarate dehydratase
MLRIVQVKATPVRVPVTRAGVMSGTVRTHVARTIVEVATDQGLTGLGETRGTYSAAIINARFAGRLQGQNAHDRANARRLCLLPHIDYGLAEQRIDLLAFAGVEIALWDLTAKAAGLPLFLLLGGAARPLAEFGGYVYSVADEKGGEAGIPRAIADVAAELVDKTGVRLIELKIGVNSLACDVATITQVRRAIGREIDLAVDANMGMSLATARRFLDETRYQCLENFEEPTDRLADFPLLQREYGISTSTHCTDFWALEGAEAAAGGSRIGAVVSDLHYHGGITAALDLAAAVVARGHRFWLRSSWELGISWAAMCHVALSSPHISRPSQTLINWISDDLVLGDVWLPRTGGVRPPEKPGLGVELDRESLDRFTAVDYLI